MLGTPIDMRFRADVMPQAQFGYRCNHRFRVGVQIVRMFGGNAEARPESADRLVHALEGREFRPFDVHLYVVEACEPEFANEAVNRGNGNLGIAVRADVMAAGLPVLLELKRTMVSWLQRPLRTRRTWPDAK